MPAGTGLNRIAGYSGLSGNPNDLALTLNLIIPIAGALLALTGSGSPLRAPLTLFFLLAAPAAGIAAALRGFDPFARALASLAGSVVLNMLVAQGMLATHRWSARGGVLAMAVISALILLLVLMLRRRTAKGQDA